MKNTQQLFPVLLAFATFIILSMVLTTCIFLLNVFPIRDKILLQIHIPDILVGFTIYIKTSVDFAIFIANLMKNYQGIKNRVAIEIGTAVGNALGTLLILCVWTFFKEIPLLMIIMILVASLVLLQMAEEGLKEFQISNFKFQIITNISSVMLRLLRMVNSLTSPVLRFIIPRAKTNAGNRKTFLSLFIFAITIPLILGLDDFAGYIPLFTIVHVFGFAVGVLAGHMLLTIALFASPITTIGVVKKPIIALLGSAVFIVIALWGLLEAFQIAFRF